MRLIVLLATVFSSMACSKVNPEVFQLGSGSGPEGSQGPPPNGRITLGSNEHVVTGGGYKLKGRVSAIAPNTGPAAGGYLLRGTVRFQ